MPSPFPGMDPWLEAPDLWPDVHHSLISGVSAALNAPLGPRGYVSRVKLRTYEFAPDDPSRDLYVADYGSGTARQRYLEIRRVSDGLAVTAIAIVSPWNKIPGSAGHRSHLRWRREVEFSGMNWVVLELLRAGEFPIDHTGLPPAAYRAVAQRTIRQRLQFVWPIGLRDRLPVLPIPLSTGEPEESLNLQAVLDQAYDRGAYHLDADDRRPPVPPLDGEDAAWADGLLKSAGLRS